jgi:hypothetical protein
VEIYFKSENSEGYVIDRTARPDDRARIRLEDVVAHVRAANLDEVDAMGCTLREDIWGEYSAAVDEWHDESGC